MPSPVSTGPFRKFCTWVRTVLRGLTSTRDNRTPDVIAIGGILLGAQFLFNSAWATLVIGRAFSPSEYGLGAGALLAAIGLSLWAKSAADYK